MKRTCRFVNGELPKWLRPQRGVNVSIGDKFGKLTIAGLPFRTRCKNGVSPTLWRVVCHCDCGSVHVIAINKLRFQVGCGCVRRRHGLYNTLIYKAWIGMKARCNDPNRRNYGAKGITVCQEWDSSFNTFLAWSEISGFRDGLVLDRINPDGNYCPENCQWLTKAENARRVLRVRMKTIAELKKENAALRSRIAELEASK